MRPTIPITDKRFLYTSAVNTNIKARFDAIRKEHEQRKQIAAGQIDRVVAIFAARREQKK